MLRVVLFFLSFLTGCLFTQLVLAVVYSKTNFEFEIHMNTNDIVGSYLRKQTLKRNSYNNGLCNNGVMCRIEREREIVVEQTQ